MKHNERQHNCVCAQCGIPASKGYIVRFGREICKRFKTYPEASQFLSEIRYKTAEGSYDHRDNQKDQPLSFKRQTEKWLAIKKEQISASHYRNLKNYTTKAINVWGNKSVKDITYGDIEDFLFSKKTTPNNKTRSNIKSCLNSFFQWIEDREDIRKPKMPKVNFELGWRSVTDLETQKQILAEVHSIAPVRAAFAIEMLATYPALRPDDLRRVTEQEYHNGLLIMHNPTKRKNKSKLIRLLPEHAECWEKLRQEYPAIGNVPFFRHPAGIKGCRENEPYGKRYLYKWWIKACQNLGIEGLDLYGGTRHSTTTAIAEMVDHESAKKASGHQTNKAFERYCQAADDTAYEMARIVKHSSPKIIDIKSKQKK